MTKLDILAITARTASLLAAPTGAKFNLASPMSWRLLREGAPVQQGESQTVGLFFDGLVPHTEYEFECALGRISFATPICGGLINCRDFGADPAHPDNHEAFAAAIAAVPEGGTLQVPAGTYFTRPVFLKSNMTLLLEAGAVLSAVAARQGWPQLEAHDGQGRVVGTWEGLPARCYAALVTAINCTRLDITGRGTIDGGGDRGDWWTWPKEMRDNAWRARTVHLIHSTAITMSGVSVKNSPSWTVHPYGCTDIDVSNITIFNPDDSPNTDGLNPESCRNVRITAVDFNVGDDCIAIKAGKRADAGENAHLAPTSGVNIQHCLMRRGHGAVVLGSEMSGSISNISVSACAFEGTDRGIRIKTRRGRGGEVRNIEAHDIDMKNVPAPFTVNAFYFCDHDGKSDRVQSRAPAPVDATTPIIANIRLRAISATGVEQVGMALLGLPEAPITGVSIDQFEVQFLADATPGIPLMALHVPAMHKEKIFSENAQVCGQISQMDGETKR